MSNYCFSDKAVAAQKTSGSTPVTPYDALSRYLKFTNRDSDGWWRRVAPFLNKLLERAGYDTHQQYQYLILLGLHIIPFLDGVPDMQRPMDYASVVGGIGPLEFSQNFTKDGSKMRIGLEPMNHKHRNGTDPYNRAAMGEALMGLKSLGISIDLQLYHQLVPLLILTDAEELEMPNATYFVKSASKTQYALALDLDKGDVTVKQYLMPRQKAAVTGLPLSELIFSAIRTVDVNEVFTDSVAMLEDFLSATYDPPVAVFVSCDLVPFHSTRFKVYVAELNQSLENIARNWTLGGRLNDSETLKGLAYAQELYTLFGIPDGTRDIISHPVIPGDPQSFSHLMFNYELQQGDPRPKPKIYYALNALNDMEKAKALVDFFKRVGWEKHAAELIDNLQSYIPGVDINETTELIGWLSFAYSEKKGPYLTIYYR
ncbi:cyclo-L-Trp-L-Trp prenyltransferase [Aspergillus campestris IBT 28561]|uniref:Cyclo-L-Trp-L-Trp prenyltransferase n=1 Tax=Aspergillus campestris (strain IBT 28561) TaxID=1392248 RepID=A0A2I1CS62_ASPC2|nr:cyclo-L-Trp-L-Trp prenyltransferase [Aspergillus campestris IBT 28561]PKY00465.1 cyclo-L-Trp-L-Trp prenyltransferase [Aspergillus campestris IBT 28561]